MFARLMLGNEKLWSCKPTGTSSPHPDVQVWAAWLDLTDTALAEFRSTLSNQEQERAARFGSHQARIRFVAARGYLRAILGACLGSRPQDIEFACGPKGKPSLCGALSHSGLQFNLAHSGDLAVFAVALHGVVGIDVEQIRPIPELPAMIEQFYSARECAHLKQLSGEEQLTAFLKIWTKKEAWLKASGDGLTDMLKSLEVLSRPGERVLSVKQPDSPAGAGFRLHELAPAPGYIGALAVTPP